MSGTEWAEPELFKCCDPACKGEPFKASEIPHRHPKSGTEWKPRGKKPSMFVPEQYRREVFKLSKAALADVAWNLAAVLAESSDEPTLVMQRLREEIETTVFHRRSIP